MKLSDFFKHDSSFGSSVEPHQLPMVKSHGMIRIILLKNVWPSGTSGEFPRPVRSSAKQKQHKLQVSFVNFNVFLVL